MRKIFLKAVIVAVFIFVFFITTPFVSAFFAHFVVNTPPANFSLAPLQSVETELSVSIDSSYNQNFVSEEDRALYRVERYHSCEQYDEWEWECIDGVDLCPYLAIQPENEESSEVGFSLNASSPYISAEGEINGVQDATDKWNISVTSPCFEGECPADYDYFINGAPLPQSSKGKTFTCNLEVNDNSPIFQSRNIIGPGVAYAQTSPNVMMISAVLTGEYTQPTTGYSNVLFIPGLEASRLYLNEWGSENQLWESNRNLDVEKLYLNEEGISIKSGIYTRDVIKETNTPLPTGFAGQNIYKSFSDTMDDLTDASLPSSEKMAKWEAYAYDWRQGVEDIVNNGTEYIGTYRNYKKFLVTTLENLVASSTTGKVTIITHSNGGLIAKALMIKLQEMKNAGTSDLVDKIDNLILVAVPQIGTATAVPSMLHGYDQAKLGGWIMDEKRARELGRNMESAYGLLPSREYINRVSASPVNFVGDIEGSDVTTSFINAYGNVVDSYVEYRDFLFGAEGRIQPAIDNTKLPINLSSYFFDKAEILHNKIDFWTPPAGLRVIEVAGWGLDTVASFEYYPRYDCRPPGLAGQIQCDYVLDERPRFTVDGDKTVVVPSAQYMSNTTGNIEKYWVNLEEHNAELVLLRRNREHKDILEVNQLNNLIKSVIKKTDIVFDTVLKNTEPIDSKNRFRLSVHSPVTLGAYDSLGNFTGKVCPTGYDFCYIMDEIPNSSYLEFGEGKYLNLPEESMKKVVLEGTDIGTFTYESEKVVPGSALRLLGLSTFL
jgi:pimeloyl-ACP methyl ester carboxylesterase